MASRYDENTNVKAVRLVRERAGDDGTEWAAMKANARHCKPKDSTRRSPGHRGDRPCPMGTLARHLSHRTVPDERPRTCPGHHKRFGVAH
jgi:hypothetical protein